MDYWLMFSKLLDSSKSAACNFAVTLFGFWSSHQQNVCSVAEYTQTGLLLCGSHKAGFKKSQTNTNAHKHTNTHTH